MAFGPADRDGTNQNKDRTWKGPSVKLWVTAPAATFPLSPVHQTGITIINVILSCGIMQVVVIADWHWWLEGVPSLPLMREMAAKWSEEET